jgi:hypothetical protein
MLLSSLFLITPNKRVLDSLANKGAALFSYFRPPSFFMLNSPFGSDGLQPKLSMIIDAKTAKEIVLTCIVKEFGLTEFT